MSEAKKKPPAEPEPESPEKKHDVVLIHGSTEDGKGVRALRSRPGRLDLAELRPLTSGQDIQATEVVRLQRRDESPMLWDVDVQWDPRRDGGHAGPPRVASAAYRRNWEQIFGARRPTAGRTPQTDDPSRLN
jgi:hypothetical protein